MSAKETFKKAWSTKFPLDSLPVLQCFDHVENDTCNRTPGYEIDIAAVEKNLQKSNELIADLNRQLQHQEFISAFLWDIIHKNDSTQITSRISKGISTPTAFETETEDEAMTLDEPIPLQDASSVSFSPGADNLDVNSPNTASPKCLDIVRNSLLIKQYSQDSSHCSKFSQLSSSSSSHGVARKKSLPMLDVEEEKEKLRDENRTYSLDSGKFMYSDDSEESHSLVNNALCSTFKPNRPELSLPSQSSLQPGLLEIVLRGKKSKPVPAPRMSIMKPLAKAELSMDRSGDSSDALSNNNFVVISTSDVLCNKQELIEEESGKGNHFQKKAMRSFQGVENKDVIGGISARRGFNSLKNLPLPSSGQNKSPTEGSPGVAEKPKLKPNILDAISQKSSIIRSGELNHQSLGKKVSIVADQSDYEEAVPVQRAFIESNEASSEDEDEPLYYNLMLLKQQTLSRVQTLYSKPDSFRGQAGNQSTKPKAEAYNQKLGFIKATEQPSGTLLSSDSVNSAGSDSVFEAGNDPQSWRKRQSMYHATDSLDSQSECDELDAVPLCPEDEKLQMRKWVIKSILESEHSYLNILDILMQYMQTFKNLLGTAQAVILSVDIDTIFRKIPDLHLSHKMFVHEIEPKMENWTSETQIAETFKQLALAEYRIAPDYLKNYQKAVVTIHRCWQDNAQFASLTKAIQVKGIKEKPSLEELLHKPVLRFQRNTLVLHDLIKCTPTSHGDYDLLQKTLQLAHTFLENLEGTDKKENPENQRYLAKQGLIVEKVENTRKLRHIFLFNDVFICARQKISIKQKIHFEPKWYIPLIDLTLDDKVSVEEEKLLADCQQQEIEILQKKVSELQYDLKSEIKQTKVNGDAQRQWSFHNKSRSLEKIKKKLIEQQAAMIKASPRLLFRLHNRRNNRHYTLLMASDYERSNWRFTIVGLLSRAQEGSLNLSSTDLQNLLNAQKLPKVSTLAALIGSEDFSLEEEHLFGNLNITIYRLQGLKQSCDTYCAVEVDSFGHFFMKAKTNVVLNNIEPSWNEDFEIDLEGAQTIRILCYKMNRDVGVLIGTCALELSKAWLRGDFQEKIVSLNDEISVTISLRYCSGEQTLKRTLSSAKGGVFGAKLKTVTKREGSNIPQVICTCVEEVDRRGLAEVGIYRVSGVSGEIQRLKKGFEKNTKIAIQMAKEMDINVVTGLLKLYFRELPEALFTDALYSSFVTGMGLSDPEAKEKYIQSILDSLPEPNHSTAIYLMDHLLSVAVNEPENKMTLQNLSTVFGPTLLRPAVKEGQQQTLEELFSSGTRDAMMQTSILLYLLNIRAKNAVS